MDVSSKWYKTINVILEHQPAESAAISTRDSPMSLLETLNKDEEFPPEGKLCVCVWINDAAVTLPTSHTLNPLIFVAFEAWWECERGKTVKGTTEFLLWMVMGNILSRLVSNFFCQKVARQRERKNHI